MTGHCILAVVFLGQPVFKLGCVVAVHELATAQDFVGGIQDLCAQIVILPADSSKRYLQASHSIV